MEILGRFNGRNGQITIAQERRTGARLYVEEGVKQSYVLPGGSPGLDYVRLMVRVLEGAPDIILFGCGGGALASELHNRGCRMTVVDDNPISFEIARRFFWMPSSILCEVDDMAEFLERGGLVSTPPSGSMLVAHHSTMNLHSTQGHALCWGGAFRAAVGSPSTSPATGLRTLPSCGSRTDFSMRTSM
jgi:hypothetical protein